MNLLLDTRVFIWWDQQSPALNAEARAAIEDPGNNIYVSAASVWEIAIKRQRGKLKFSGLASAAIGANGFHELPIPPLEAEEADGLPWLRADPFDRLLAAQAMRLGMSLVTADRAIQDFGAITQLLAG